MTGLQTESIAGQWVTTGQLVSEFATRQSFVQLVAIHRDAAGAIMGGEGAGSRRSSPGRRPASRSSTRRRTGRSAATEVHWQVTR